MGRSSAKTELVAHMVSCDRQPNYARDSVRHFRGGSDMPLTVFVDGDDDSYLGDYDNVTTVVGPVTQGQPGVLTPYERCRLNTIRAVQSTPEGADLLLLEDDIAFAVGWHEKLMHALDYSRSKFGSRFILSLYSAKKPGAKDGPIAHYHHWYYYGNIAVVLSREVVRYFLEMSAQTDLLPDMVVREIAKEHGIALKQTDPNLAQHLGDMSTMGVRRIVRSATFKGKFAGGPREHREASRKVKTNKAAKEKFVTQRIKMNKRASDKFITQKVKAKKPPLGGFSMGEDHLAWLRSRLPEGKTILELGSGNGTAHLCERWTVYSVEHDSRFVGLHGSHYIHAPIVDGWYDVEVLKAELPSDYDLLLVDGPPGQIGRRRLLRHLDLFRDDVPVMVDDTQRTHEQQIARRLGQILQRKPVVMPCGDGRSFTVLEPPVKGAAEGASTSQGKADSSPPTTLPPLVGVVTHDPMGTLRLELLERTVRSIETAFPTAELFLLDNGSTDGSWEAVGELLGARGEGCPSCGGEAQRGRWHVQQGRGTPDGNFTPGAGRHRLYYHMFSHTCGGEARAPFWVWSDDDIIWKPKTEETLTRFWADAPRDIAIVGGYLEPVWHWNTPRETVEAGGVRVLVRDSTPGGAWTFGNRRVIPVPCNDALHRFGYDTITCGLLRDQGLRIAQLDVADHIGWECSSHGNNAMDRLDSRPLDREKWGV